MINEVEYLVRKMDVPFNKKRNMRWLQDHLAERNQQHPDFEKVMQLVKTLISNGIMHD
jgi:hypothetical protein